MIIRLAFQTAEKLEELEVAEKHMKEGMRQFENAAEDCSNVADTYLEPLRMDMDHMPDYARLDKPKRPPVPEAPAVMSAANGMNGALADPAVAPAVVGGWASNDAFASGFDDNKSPVSTIFFRSSHIQSSFS